MLARQLRDDTQKSQTSWTRPDVLLDLEQNGEWDFVRELIDTFLDDAASRIQHMRKAATDRDLTGVASYCHALRGSALAVNAARLVEISNQIEGYVSLHQQPDYLALIDRLDLALVEIRQTLTCYRQSLPRNQAA